jgi:hypothetical protein
MISKDEIKNYDKYRGVFLSVVIAIGVFSGVVFSNWRIVEIMFNQTTLTVVFLLLMYRLVIAVENMSYEE